MALSRVLDIYKRVASRRGQAPAKQLTSTQIKGQLWSPSGSGRSPLNRFANRPVKPQSAFFEFCSFFASEFFSFRIVSGGVFSRRPILIPSNLFSVILQLYYALPKKLQYVLNFCKEKPKPNTFVFGLGFDWRRKRVGLSARACEFTHLAKRATESSSAQPSAIKLRGIFLS